MYIGQTTQPRGFKDRYCADGNGIERVYQYYEASKRYGCSYNVHLFNSIKKYGFDNFEVNEVFDIAYNKKDLDLKEEQYILKYKSYDINHGYNIELGGNNKKKSDYAKFLYAKKSYPVYCITNKKCFLSPREVELEYGLRKGRISNGLNKYYIYKVKTEQFGILKFKRLFEDINLKHRNPVICLNTKEIFISVNSASKYHNIEKNKIIRNCNNGNKINDNECKYWIYAKDFYDTIIYNNDRKSENNITNMGSKVICLTTKEEFESINKAIKKYNLNKDNLMKCCRGVKDTCGRLSDGTKLKWSYI